MKSKSIIFYLILFLHTNILAENLIIESKNITIDKKKETTIFEKEVIVKTRDKVIKSNYVEYDKKNKFLLIKENIIATDDKNNIVKTELAEYFEDKEIFISKGPTKIVTSENYVINGESIIFDNKKKLILSKKKSSIIDEDGNIIYLDNFEYKINENIFKSLGVIKIEDKNKNIYEFSQIYIDTKKKEILGTDIKSFINQKSFKIDPRNKPRVFANTMQLSKSKNLFNKSIFTLCDYRKNDKCPPWSIQASQMLHDNKKKTIYYDNAVIKVYDIPIFYFPKLSHADPTVDRRSGFLPPSFSSSKNLGTGISVPYFFNLAGDKNFTFTNRIYASENPLFLGEYHQAFKNSNLLADFGFTEGYKKTSSSKKSGQKTHLFSKFIKNFKGKNNSNNSLTVSLQDVSNDKYLKLYKIKSNLVDYNKDTLENSINFTHENDDIFFGFNTSMYETLKDDYEDKYEYIFPEITIDKNLLNHEKLGSLDLQTNFKAHNYDTNKFTNFLVNDFDWNSKELFFESGINTKILGNIRNINYEAKNVDLYKKDPSSEFYGSLGLLSQLNLEKIQGNAKHSLTPKMLLRFSPGSMRQEETGSRLDPLKAFSLNRLNNLNNYETGVSGTLGFDYRTKSQNKSFDFSVAQIINDKENKKMASETSLDEKLSDLVGSANLNLGDRISLNYKFALDQNYSDLNYNEIGSKFDFGSMNIDFGYLQEKKHIGNQDYFTTKLNYKNKKNSLVSFETKRDLITNSAEFYNLSYEYTNDCLKAGLVYRREFYNDSEIEPENSLMFKITLIPFGNINSPTFGK
tara:strand:+ start:26460 stop:28856 length:2397 start_codon:yes stop_codon:yes gene_type:complete